MEHGLALKGWLKDASHPMFVLQKTKGEDRRREVQAQLTQVQQQIREEESRRRRQVWEAGQKVGDITLLLPHFLHTCSSGGKPTAGFQCTLSC